MCINIEITAHRGSMRTQEKKSAGCILERREDRSDLAAAFAAVYLVCKHGGNYSGCGADDLERNTKEEMMLDDYTKVGEPNTPIEKAIHATIYGVNNEQEWKQHALVLAEEVQRMRYEKYAIRTDNIPIYDEIDVSWPPHIGLTLDHNPHKALYMKVSEWLTEIGPFKLYDVDHILGEEFASEEQYKECVKTDELWVLTWSPVSPVGEFVVMGPTFNSVMRRSREIVDQEGRRNEY